jgi:hypothetical protein
VTVLLGSGISEGSTQTYSTAFKHWVEWRSVGRKSLWLDEDNGNVEGELLKFVAHRGLTLGYAHGSVHVMLNAIRSRYMRERKGNPMKDKQLLAMAMKGLKRLQVGVVRKIPATVDLLRETIGLLNLEDWDQLVIATSMMFMFLFMARSREAVRKGKQPDLKQCLRNHMFVFYGEGKEVKRDDIQLADEVVW